MKCSKCTSPLPWGIALAAGILLALVLVWALSLRARNTALEAQFSQLEETRNHLEAQLEDAREEATALRFGAEQYDHILRSLQSCDIGFSTANFRSYDSIIVVNQDDRDRKFTLVANWDQPGTVQVSYSGDTATVSFDEPSWEDKTTLTVHPRSVGATVVTFTNDVDSGRFKVLILVTE